MARATFGNGIADFVTQTIGGGLQKVVPANLTFWSAKTGGTQYADLLLGGSPVASIAVGTDGQVPQFQGPNGVFTMWADGGGARVQIVAVADAVAQATAPTDTSVATAIGTPGSATAAALSASYAALGDGGRVGYAMLGQSNTKWGLGIDPLFDRTPDRVDQWPSSGAYMGQIVAAAEPLFNFDGSLANSIGPMTTFARDIVKLTPVNNDVVILPCGWGATGFTPSSDRTWDVDDTTTGTNLAHMSFTQIDSFLAENPLNRIGAIFWQQGEADVLTMTQSQYATKLDRLITELRARYRDVPIIIRSMTPQRIFESGIAGYAGVNAAHADIPRRWERSWFFYGTPGETQDGGIHYNAKAQRLDGHRFVAAFHAALANVSGTAPVVPTGLVLTQAGTTITATWDWAPGRMTGTQLQYRANGGSWQTVAGLGSVVDPRGAIAGLTLGDTIDVRVSAINAVGTSTPSSVATIVLDTIPAASTSITLGTATSFTQPLSWTAVTGARSYQLEYKTHASGTWLTGPLVTGTSTTVTGLTASTNYDYRVKAVNFAGTGAASATATGLTADPVALSADVGATPLWAYGLRRLVTGYGGNLIRVRRSSDNTEQDIGMVAGLLDTASLLTFCGAGNGNIVTWYDQSGGSHHATQATTTKQPRIVNAGVVETKNSQPAAYFDGGDVLTHSTPAILAAAVGTMLALATTRAANTTIFSESGATQSVSRWIPVYSSSGLAQVQQTGNDSNVSVTVISGATQANDGALHQTTAVYDPAASTISQDGTQVASGALARSGTYTPTIVAIGGWTATPTFPHTGHITEIAVWNTALGSVARAAGESNQKSYVGL